MSFENLTNFGAKYNLPPTILTNVKKELLALRKSDVLTTNKLARDVSIDTDFARTLLADMVNEGILEVIIVVGCMNEEYSHIKIFYSFEDYYNNHSNIECSECGAPLDFSQAKIGFKRGNF
jgi:hypothetical protein